MNELLKQFNSVDKFDEIKWECDEHEESSQGPLENNMVMAEVRVRKF